MNEEELDGVETELEADIERELQESEETAPPEDEEVQEEESEESGDSDEEPEEDERISGFQKRINKRTADYYREKQERERLERELEELRNKPAQYATTEKPTLEKFDYDEEKYQEALIEWKADQVIESRFTKRQQEEQQNTFEKKVRDFQEKVRKANIPNYDEVVYDLATNVRLPMDVLDAIHADDKGPEIMVYLGKNLDIADDLTRMNPIMAGRTLADISHKLSSARTKKTTQAPDPVKPLKTGGKIKKSMDEMSMDEIDSLEL